MSSPGRQPLSSEARTDGYFKIIARMHKALKAAGRAPDSAILTAVSKNQPWEAVEPVLAAGHRRFGENRVQEATERWADVRPDYPDLELRLIGPLQSNKAAEAVGFFDVIESVDRDRIARVLADEIQKQGPKLKKAPALYVQVNIGEEPQKAGVAPHEADAFLKTAREVYGLNIAGLLFDAIEARGTGNGERGTGQRRGRGPGA